MSGNLLTDIGSIWTKYGSVYLDGIANTLILATTATLIGCIIGFFCGILQTIPYGPNDFIVKRFILKLVRIIIRAYVEIFRGTPMILQAVFIYYGLPYFFKINFTDIWVVSILVVSINTGAYMAESVRGGIMSIDKGQFEGAKAIGMNHWQTMLYVVLPQTLRNILPQIGNNYIINVKDTSVMFIIGFQDFFAVHKMVSGAVFKYFPSAFMEMSGYLCLTLLASFLLRRLEKKLAGKSNYELVNTDQLVMTAGTYSYPEDTEKGKV
ncbi:amino acid ABC transporter permease [Aristaeella lactis]|uniref:Lysine transport system permease protein n=1 Tax=Aristaeella lactis TaxID=3046383 RepID=A0AC61PJ26_9FIRM|nr:amino acid ABC transporter permease [Aristaeella lactis]QUA53906.1 amino acid ABC transporter permease [Aristaeella lactis]SMC40864.1 putative lysine transport system permease protein [Aristaeella lactis]